MVHYAFIDAQNVNLSVMEQGWKVDWKKFFIYLRDQYKILKAFLFIGYLPQHEKLYTFLKDCGFILVFKKIIENQQVVKGNCDGELILRCMLEYKNFDKALIMTGDGDFYCLLEQLKNDQKLLKLGIPNKRKYSALLRVFRHPYIFYLSDLKDKIGYLKTERD